MGNRNFVHNDKQMIQLFPHVTHKLLFRLISQKSIYAWQVIINAYICIRFHANWQTKQTQYIKIAWKRYRWPDIYEPTVEVSHLSYFVIGSKNRKTASETLDASMSRDKRKRSALDLLGRYPSDNILIHAELDADCHLL